jgi:hypothetical protein
VGVHDRSVRFALVWACALLWACDGETADPGDGGIELPDARVDPDGGMEEACTSNGACEDGDRCTENACIEGRCMNTVHPDCLDCATDADCADGDVCTIDLCWIGECRWEWSSAECECSTGAECDDFNRQTIDRCVDNECFYEVDPCESDAECDDFVACTIDRCDSPICTNTPTPACDSGCPDRDGDGYGWEFCAENPDCDDFNPAVHPGADEGCADGLDNDCDGARDAVDTDCSTGGESCETARALTPGVALEGSVIWPGGFGDAASCGESVFFTLELTETSDIDVTVTVEEPPPPPPVPGCPECTGEHRWDVWYRMLFDSVCDAPSEGAAWCYSYSSFGFFGGDMQTLRLRRVEAGTYTIELEASDRASWMPVPVGYTITANVSTSSPLMCESATVLTEGAIASGRTGSGLDAFTSDCAGAVADGEERLYSFTLSERRRVRLEAIGTPDVASGAIPGLRVGVYPACEPDAERTACLEHTGGECHRASTIERVLDAGTYYATVEARYGGDVGFDLSLTTEAIDAACEGAAAIVGSGSITGSTEGAPDRFRDSSVCGDGYGPDVVYRVEVAERSRVVLDLIASYAASMITLHRRCGEDWVAGGRGAGRIDTTLEPGTYYAVVGGDRADAFGSYILNTTYVPAPGM